MYTYDRASTVTDEEAQASPEAATTLSPTLQQQQSDHQYSVLRRTSQNALNTIFNPDSSNNKDKVRALSFASDISVSTSISSGNSASSPLLYPSTGRSWSLSSQPQDETESTEWSMDRGRKQKYWRKRMSRRSGQYQVTSDHVKVLRVIWYLTLVFGEHAAFWIMLRRCEWPTKASWVSKIIRCRLFPCSRHKRNSYADTFTICLPTFTRTRARRQFRNGTGSSPLPTHSLQTGTRTNRQGWRSG